MQQVAQALALGHRARAGEFQFVRRDRPPPRYWPESACFDLS